MDLRRLNENLEALNDSVHLPILSQNNVNTDDSFSVLKDRHAILATVESIISEAEQEAWLLLGRWGILHILRSGVIKTINDALNRGVDIKLVICLDEKTIRFYDQIDNRIEIRHHPNFNLCGVFVDKEVGIQYVQTEDTPTGRGKEDTAILMESEMLLSAQSELLNIQWNAANSYSSAKAKIVDGMMTEPLQLTLGEGSFYERFKESLKLGINQKTNTVLTKGGEEMILQNNSGPTTLSALGINTNQLFQDVGERIGQELAVKLQNVEDDQKFWLKIKSEWGELGMGNIEFDKLPPTRITVYDGNACNGEPQTSGMFCNMDESVIAGIVKERYGKQIDSCQRMCAEEEKPECAYEISILD